MPRERWALIVGSLGFGLMLAGLIVFLGQAVAAMNTGEWPPTTLGTLLKDPVMLGLVPAELRAWLDQPQSWHALHGPVDWIVDTVPLALLLGGVGLLMAWKSLRLDRSRVGE